jgi:hypothetical protein
LNTSVLLAPPREADHERLTDHRRKAF